MEDLLTKYLKVTPMNWSTVTTVHNDTFYLDSGCDEVIW